MACLFSPAGIGIPRVSPWRNLKVVLRERLPTIGSPTQMVSRFGVHPTQVATWKKRLVEGAEELFTDQRRKNLAGADEQGLYEQISRLQGSDRHCLREVRFPTIGERGPKGA